MEQIQKIQQKFNEVIAYSQNIEYPKTDELFGKWYKNKEYFIKTLFNGELKYTYPEKVKFDINMDVKISKYAEFIEYVGFVMNLPLIDPFFEYLTSIPAADFYDNELKRDYFIGEKKIPAGMKVVKSFKYFIEDKVLLSDIQNKASNFIQENKIEGYLTFSVHPLDFLSLSENTFNWRSCHALDGEYRSGNLSYMGDASTVVCYLSDGNDVVLPHFPPNVKWNSKKWRCLFHFNNFYDVIFAGRQYPFTSAGALETIRKIFIDELIPTEHSWLKGDFKAHWTHWHNDYISEVPYSEYSDEDNGHCYEEDEYFLAKGRIWNRYDVVHDAPNSTHYNDILRSTCYLKPYYMYRKEGISSNIDFIIGSNVSCLSCGEDTIFGANGHMLCKNCSNELVDDDMYAVCDCCGRGDYIEDMTWVMDSYVCQSCINTECFYCEECQEWHYNDSKVYDEENQRFICADCKRRKEDKNGSERNACEAEPDPEVSDTPW